jgi:hypothetical protein
MIVDFPDPGKPVRRMFFGKTSPSNSKASLLNE